MDIQITKADVLWSYIAQVIQMTAGLFVLPVVLIKLPSEEVGFNYIMLTIGSMVTLLDFGFSPQFSRNISYIYGGAQTLLKEGFIETKSEQINWTLLSSMVVIAKKVYLHLSLFAMLLMLTIGLWYVYDVSNCFTLIDNVLIIWSIYSSSVFFNIYVSYYNALLSGSGKIKETKIAIIISRLIYVISSILFLYMDFGLIGLSISYLIQSFIYSIISKRFFFNKKTILILKEHPADMKKTKEMYDVIWYNAKKLGINSIGAYGITKMGMFFAGLYLSLDDVSSYGLMVQLITAIAAVSLIVFTAYIPQISAYRISGNKDKVILLSSFSLFIFYLLFSILSILLIFVGPIILNYIGSSSKLPDEYILVIYALIIMLENNHSAFATLITTSNQVPFVKAGLLSGLFISLLSFISLKYTNYGILGIVLCQGICQAAYNNWKWPKWVLNDFCISFPKFYIIGLKQFIHKIFII